MNIGGFQKFSLIDYPDKVSAVIFTQGCNFRCHYCHNPELIDFSTGIIKENEILAFLDKRQGLLDGVAITGGEPTLQPNLINFLNKIKNLGYLIKLDSNGSKPEVIQELIKLKLVDYIAMDIKAPLEKYDLITNSKVNLEKINLSIDLVKRSGINYEFRTTVVKSQLAREDFSNLGKLLNGSNKYFLQKFIASKPLNPKYQTEISYEDTEFIEIKTILNKYIDNCSVR